MKNQMNTTKRYLKTGLSKFPKVPIWTSGPMWSGSSVGNGYGMSFDDGDWFVKEDESPAPRLRSWPYIDPDLRWPDACLVCIRITVWCLSDEWSDRLGYFGTGSFLKYSIPTTKVSMISKTAACLSSCGSERRLCLVSHPRASTRSVACPNTCKIRPSVRSVLHAGWGQSSCSCIHPSSSSSSYISE